LTKTIDVEIYGQRYAIRGDADDAYIRRLAHYVDDQMKHLAEGMKTAIAVFIPSARCFI